MSGVEDYLTELHLPASEDAEIVALVRAARARIWKAVNTLESGNAPPWWFRVRRLARRAGWLPTP